MSIYPFELDDDTTIIRISDNISELGEESINQLRSAMFAVQGALGTKPAGSKSTVAARLNVSLNPDGSIKSSALTSVGLATLPITDNQVASTAGIKESKLALNHSTSDLNTLIASNTALLSSLDAFAKATDSDLSTHIGGGAVLADGSPGRHVASHIDLNATPSDSRDTAFSWSGLLDKDGNPRSATQVAQALQQINDAFVAHQNATQGAHVATAITLDTSSFETIPLSVDTAQKLADHIDDFETITVGRHLATQHANGIPLISRSQGCDLPDGYRQNVVPPTPADAFLVRSPNVSPVDDISTGDDIIKFSPDNSGFVFDSQFGQVVPGDMLTINYNNGMEATFLVDSIRFVPGNEWIVRIDGNNLADTDGYAALARIDRPPFDRRTEGVLALAPANATPTGSFDSILASAIVGHPRGAMVMGFGFDPGQLDADHYNLYLEMYPTGNPSDHIISLPAVDVTGDAGASVGSYTLEKVVENINDGFREIGFNFRMIAFAENGNIGIMMADAINCASFSVIKGVNSSGTLVEGSYVNNVIGEASGTDFDALGLGSAHADVAGPAFISSFPDSTAASLPSKIITPKKKRDYIVNGRRRDGFDPTWNATKDSNGDYYWDGYISARNEVGSFTVETTYVVDLDLKAAGLKAGKTLVVQPTVGFGDPQYFDVDYGRFIIKEVNFIPACPGELEKTSITVINGLHAAGTGFAFSSGPDLPVKIYFSSDSVEFNNEHVINQTPTAKDFHRLHEIFVDEDGKTFSHERARMPIQSAVGDKMDTTQWHVEDVSPKLRGYRDNLTTYNKYLRFYVLDYNAVTGEYDGYVGQRDPSSSGILNTGPITRGRKNIPTRFYDETYNDYIDLVFEELGSSSTALLTNKYVDIEIFDSLRRQDELMLLGTVEVNWDPPAGQRIVQRVRNRREFGSIDEEDFTSSAVDFITAGDRALHSNGIVRGFGFDSVNSSDNREIFYKGGVAFVNGKIVTTNNQSVTIPELLEDGYSVPTTVDWAVCVNEEGELEPIIVTSTKREFFAEDNISSNVYYLPSVTFNELINTRKDLVPISVVTANIASVTIAASDISDVRRMVERQDLVPPLTLAGEDFVGNFSTLDAVINWIRNFGETATSTVKVRGEIEVSSSVDLTSIQTPVVFQGDGAVFNVTAGQGLKVGKNISFHNIDFKYNPSGLTLTSADYINTGNGCIYYTSQPEGLERLEISDCNFTSSAVAERPPFINLEVVNNDLVRDVRITQNQFDDPSGDGYRAAIALVGLNTGASSEPAVISNALIANNRCNQRQGIYLTSSNRTGGALDSPGISVQNAEIKSNICGVIGYLVSSEVNDGYQTDASLLGNIKNNSLRILGNSCHFIGTALSDGTSLATAVGSGDDANLTYALGNVIIEGNSSNWIHSQVASLNSGSLMSSLQVNNNVLSGYDFNYLSNIIDSTAANSWAIAVRCFKANDESSCLISGNVIDGYGSNSSRLYDMGIRSGVSSKIVNNSIRGFADIAYGIVVGTDVSGEDRDFLVSGNHLRRESTDLAAYFAGLSNNDSALIVDNVLDSSTSNSSLTNIITLLEGSGWVVERNKNQTETVYINNPSSVAISDQPIPVTDGTGFASQINQSSSISSTFITDAIEGNYVATDPQVSFVVRAPLLSFLPEGVAIVDAQVTLDLSADTSTRTGYIRISRASATTAEDTGTMSTAGLTLNISNSVNFSTATFKNTATNNLQLEVEAVVSDGAVNTVVSISSISVTYRY